MAAIVHWSGPLDEGENAMKPFRDFAPRVGEMVAPMPYPWLNGAFDAIFPKGIRSYWKGNFVTELTDEAIEQHVIHGSKVPEVSATMHLYPINGAVHDVGSDETAFAFRYLRLGHDTRTGARVRTRRRRRRHRRVQRAPDLGQDAGARPGGAGGGRARGPGASRSSPSARRALYRWFAPQAAAELLHFRSLIPEHASQDVLRVVLARAARSARLTTHFDLDFPRAPQVGEYWCHKHRRTCRPVETANKFLSRYLVDTAARIERFADVRDPQRAAVVLHGDARELELGGLTTASSPRRPTRG